MIPDADRILRGLGTSYRDVVRTWFYLPEILAWYPSFNAARNDLYEDLGLLPARRGAPHLLPASTGIEGEVPGTRSAAIDLAAVAVGESSGVRVRRLASPAQIDAFRYGSAFARAVRVDTRTESVIHVSGTAAVDEAGTSLHFGDGRAQIECTLAKVAALLRPEGAGLADIVAATAFVKRPELAAVVAEVLASRGLADMPVVCVVASVCRDELLFEMEAEVLLDPRAVVSGE